ncbi:MAG: myo-inosose-2 dehydratase [Spirochaetaceae bacterium 4572_59]|nr:MAG: myo-inosose-2 dehydratase [Spirochaetaceae bacterium 4572_59]
MNKDYVKLAMAPIGWTNDDMPDLGAENTFEQCVSEMALAGYTGSEVGNKYPKDPSVLKKYLDIRDIQICNQWFSSFLASQPFEQVEKDFRSQLSFLKAMGADVIGPSEQTRSCQGQLEVPIFSGKATFNSDEFRRLTDGMNKLGNIAREEGMKLAFHHHMGTAVQTMEETERFLNDTDPDKVYLLFDSGHFSFSGEDPVKALEKFISRVGHVHLKDMRDDVYAEVQKKNSSFLDAVRDGVFTVPGDGNVDFPSIFKILEDNNYKGWMVVEAEQDPAKANPFAYAKMARGYIRKHTGI